MPAHPISLWPCNPYTQRLYATKLSSNGDDIVYVNGRTVIIRSLSDPAKSKSYSQHTQTATVARISPSGYYCASADVSGTVRIWDIAGTDQVLKLETKALGGRINDLAWDGESKRIIAVGDGREQFGSAFFVDSGSRCGEIQGSSKLLNAVSIRHQRPFRAVTASDDASIVFFTGVPYKSERVIRTHTRFVQDIRYSSTGDHFASVGSDGKLFLYDGKDGATLGEMDASQGTVLALSWDPESKHIATSSADGTVRLWDIETRKSTATYTIGTDTLDQQNGNVWANPNSIVSLSLDGTLNVIDPRSKADIRKIHGPTKAITAATLTTQPEQTFYTGSFDGSIRAFDVSSGTCSSITGSKGDGQVTALATDSSNNKVHLTGWGDDGALQTIIGHEFSHNSNPLIGVSGTKGLSSSKGRVALADTRGVTVVNDDGTSVISIANESGYSSVAIHNGLLAYGGLDKKIHLVNLDGDEEEAIFDDSRGEILALSFSADGHYLAGGDSSGRIVLIDVPEKKTLVGSRWTAHTGRVQALSFSPDHLRLASAGLDESIYIWSTKQTLKNVPLKNSHAGGVTGVAWQDDSTIISVGADACVRTWKIEGI